MKSENETKATAAKSFEDLHIYQRARELANAIYRHARAARQAALHHTRHV